MVKSVEEAELNDVVVKVEVPRSEMVEQEVDPLFIPELLPVECILEDVKPSIEGVKLSDKQTEGYNHVTNFQILSEVKDVLDSIIDHVVQEEIEDVTGSSKENIPPVELYRHQEIETKPCSVLIHRLTLVDLWELTEAKKTKHMEPATCPYCLLVFARKSYVRYHIKKVHMNIAKERRHQCHLCEKTFSKQWDVKHHIFSVHTNGVQRCFFKHCNIVAEEKEMRRHLLTVHKITKDPRQYKCDHCGRRYWDKPKLHQHLEARHQLLVSDLTHRCKLCPSKFSTRHRLRKHRLQHHSNATEKDTPEDIPTPRLSPTPPILRALSLTALHPPVLEAVPSPPRSPLIQDRPPLLLPVYQLSATSTSPTSITIRRSILKPPRQSYDEAPPEVVEKEKINHFSENTSNQPTNTHLETKKELIVNSSVPDKRNGRATSTWDWLDRERPRCDICGKCFQQRSNIRRHKMVVHGAIDTSQITQKDTESSLPLLVAENQIKVKKGEEDTLTEVQAILDELIDCVEQTELASASKEPGNKPSARTENEGASLSLDDADGTSPSPVTADVPPSRNKECSIKKGKNRYPCSYCRKVFYMSGSRWLHEKLHQNVAKYGCPLCPEMFITPERLYYHKKTVHNYSKSESPDNPAPAPSLVAAPHRPKKVRFQLDEDEEIRRNVKHEEEVIRESHGTTQESTVKVNMNVIKGLLRPCHVRVQRLSPMDIWEKSVTTQQVTWKDPARCAYCSTIFCSRYSLKEHVLRVHGDMERRHICSTCGAACFNERDLRKHIFQRHTTGIVTCAVCRKYFKESALQEHYLQVHNLKSDPRPFRCNQCGRRYMKQAALLQHVQKEHMRVTSSLVINGRSKPRLNIREQMSVAICLFCGLRFDHYVHLEIHMNQHTLEKHYKCQLCPESFLYRASLWTHHRKRHANSNKTKAIHQTSKAAKNIFGGTISENTNDQVSISTGVKDNLPSDQKRYRCDICLKGFNWKRNVRRHALKFHGKVYIPPIAKSYTEIVNRVKENVHRCNICTEVFSSSEILSQHRVSFHPEKMAQPMPSTSQKKVNKRGRYRCKICCRVFTRRDNLARHNINVHQNNTYLHPNPGGRHICRICGKGFTRPNHLVKHDINVHQKKITVGAQKLKHEDPKRKVFRCDICWKTFSRHCHVVRHQMNIHQKITVSVPKLKQKDPNRKVFPCNICWKTFSRQCHVVRHKISIHDKKITLKASKLKREDYKRKLYSCNICWKKFSCPTHVIRHKTWVHREIVSGTGAPPASTSSSNVDKRCSICDKVYYSRQNLQRHINTFHPEKISDRIAAKSEVKEESSKEEEEARLMPEKRSPDEFDGVKKESLTDVDLAPPQVPFSKKSKSYSCSHCGKVFSKSHCRWVHEKLHLNIHKYKCPLCSEKFVTPGHLYYHKRSAHNYRKTDVAVRVNVSTNPSAPSEDLESRRLLEKFNLQPCVVRLERDSAFQLWQQTSQAKKLRRDACWRCPFCGLVCVRKDALKTHVARMHGTDQDRHYECFKCGKKFIAGEHLKRHIFQTHTKGVLICAVKKCRFAATEPALMAHLLRVHNLTEDPRKHNCSTCGRRYFLVGQLLYHVRVAHGTSLRCDFCCKVFSSKFNVQRHMKSAHPGLDTSHTTDDLTCHVCHKRFQSKHNVWRHMKFVHPTKHLRKSGVEEEEAKCYVCNKKFCSKYSLRRHNIAVHGHEFKSLKKKIQASDNTVRKADLTRVTFKLRFAYALVKRSWRIRTNTLTRFQKRLREFRRCPSGKLQPWRCDSCKVIFSTRLGLKRHSCAPIKTVVKEENQQPPQLWEKIKSLPAVMEKKEEIKALPDPTLFFNDSDHQFLEMICKLPGQG